MSDFYTKQLAKLVGGTVETVITDTRHDEFDFDQQFFGLRINVQGQRFDLWILRDIEGNEPGSFDLTPVEGGGQ